jgi:hypothetical protein
MAHVQSLGTYTSRTPNIITASPHTLPRVTQRQCRACNHNMLVKQQRKIYRSLHVKCPTFLPNFNHMLIFVTSFQKFQISNVMRIHPVVAEVIHVNRETVRHNEAKRHFLQL